MHRMHLCMTLRVAIRCGRRVVSVGSRRLEPGWGTVRSPLSYTVYALLPESFGALTALKVLGLSYNQLTALPESIGALTALTELHLYNNQLTALPESFGALTALTALELHGNPLQRPPLGVCQQGLRAIRQYFAQLARDGATRSRGGAGAEDAGPPEPSDAGKRGTLRDRTMSEGNPSASAGGGASRGARGGGIRTRGSHERPSGHDDDYGIATRPRGEPERGTRRRRIETNPRSAAKRRDARGRRAGRAGPRARVGRRAGARTERAVRSPLGRAHN